MIFSIAFEYNNNCCVSKVSFQCQRAILARRRRCLPKMKSTSLPDF